MSAGPYLCIILAFSQFRARENEMLEYMSLYIYIYIYI